MDDQLQVTFLGVEHSATLEARVRERARKLERFAQHITALHVTIDVPHQQHHKGSLYEVRIDLRMRNEELAVSRAHRHDHAHEDAFAAIRDAFDAVTRQLEDRLHRQREGAGNGASVRGAMFGRAR
jgi:ribosomal subunit interface protein